MSDILITSLFTMIGAFPFAWIVAGKFMKRKLKAEATGTELDNAHKLAELFTQLSDQNKEIFKLRTELFEIKNELVSLKNNACYNLKCPNRKSRK